MEIPMIRNVLRLMIACTVGACAVAPATSPQVQSEADEVAVSSIETASAPTTPAMLAAALTGDPQAMADSVNLLSCPAPFTCTPTSAWSCQNWSGPTFCDTQCTTQVCAEGTIEKDFSSEFRICNSLTGGGQCTEFRIITTNSCGC
jgi:hypothetical protein